MQNINRLRPESIVDNYNNSNNSPERRVKSPAIGSTILTLRRGKTLIQQDTSFLMPFDPKKLNRNQQIVEIKRVKDFRDNNLNKSLSSQSGISMMSRKKSEGVLSNISESIMTSTVRNSTVQSRMRRSTVKLDQTLQNYHRQQSNATNQSASGASGQGSRQNGVKGILKRAITVFSKRETPSPATMRSRKSRDRNSQSEGTSQSSMVTKYRKKYLMQKQKKQSNHFDLGKSKDLFNVLKQGAFQDQPLQNDNMAMLHLMDLNRIAKQSTIKSNSKSRKTHQKSRKSEKKSRRKHMNLRNFQRSSSINLGDNRNNFIGTLPNQYLLTPLNDAGMKRRSGGDSPKKVDIRKLGSFASNISNFGAKQQLADLSNIAVHSQNNMFVKRRSIFGGAVKSISKIESSDEENNQGKGGLQRKKTLHFRARKYGEEIKNKKDALNNKNKRQTAMFGHPDDSLQTDEDFNENGQNHHAHSQILQPPSRQNSKNQAMRKRMKRQSTVQVKLRQNTLMRKIEEIKQEMMEEKTKLREEIQVKRAKTRMKKSQMKKSFQKSQNESYKEVNSDEEDLIFKKSFHCSDAFCCKNDYLFNDSDITSDDCEENGFIFSTMRKSEKQKHLTDLWKSCYIKAKAGVNVINLFNDLNKKIYLFGISRGLTDLQLEENPPWYIIMPADQFRGIWNIFSIVLLLYTAIVMPFKIAFIDQDDPINYIIELIVDGLFGLDMIFTFISAYEDLDGSIQNSLKKIANNYIRSNFIFDCLAIFPFQNVFQGKSYQKMIRLFRLPRLFRMFKIMTILKEVKFLKQNKNFNKILKKLSMNTAIVRMIQGMIASLVVTHLFACLFFLTSKLDDFNPDTWVYRMDVIDLDVFVQYLWALYWATQTILTLGYGDIPLVSTSEMTISLFWMVFGVGFYSFIIGNFSSIISGNIQIQATILLKIKSLADLAKKAQIPLELSRKIKKFIENNYEAIYNQEDEAQLIKMLPPSLRDEVLSNTYGEIIEKVKFFRDLKDPDFLWKILPLLRPMKLEKADILYWRGDHADDLYFIMRGQIKIYTEKGYPYMKYQEGDLFGDSDTLLNLPRDGKAIAMTHIKLMVLKVDQMFERTFENQEKNFMEMIFNARKKRNDHLRQIQKANIRAKMDKSARTITKNNKSVMESANDVFQSEEKFTTIDNVPTQNNDNGLFGNFKKTIVHSLFKGQAQENLKIGQHKSAYEKMLQRKAQQMDKIDGLLESDSNSKFPSFNNPSISFFGKKSQNSKNSSDKDLVKSIGANFNLRVQKKTMFQKMSSSLLQSDISMNPMAAALESSLQNKFESFTGNFGLGTGGINKHPSLQSQTNLLSSNDGPLSLFPPIPSQLQKNNSSGRLQRKLSIIEEYKPDQKPLGKQSSVELLHASTQQNNAYQQFQKDQLFSKQKSSVGEQNNYNSSNSQARSNSQKNLSGRFGFIGKQKTHETFSKQSIKFRENNKSSKFDSKQSSGIDINSLKIGTGKSGPQSILGKVLASAFKDQDLGQIYQKYPVLKDLNIPEGSIKIASPMKPQYSKVMHSPSETSRVLTHRNHDEGIMMNASKFSDNHLHVDLQSSNHQSDRSTIVQPDSSTPTSNHSYPLKIEEIKTQNRKQDSSLKGESKPKIPSLFGRKIEKQQVIEHISPSQDRGSSQSQNSLRQDSLQISISQINQDIERLNQKIEKAVDDLGEGTNKNSLDSDESYDQNKNDNIQMYGYAQKKVTDNDFRTLNMPKIIIQDKPQKLDQNKQIQISQKSTTTNIHAMNYNNLTPIRVVQYNYNKARELMNKKNSVTVERTNTDAQQILKQRTSSVRVIAPRPSFLIMRRNSKVSTLAQVGVKQSRFISPLSMQRICSMDPTMINNLSQKLQQMQGNSSNANKSITPLASPLFRNYNQQLERASSNKTGGRYSISEAVSQAVQKSIFHKQNQRNDSKNLNKDLLDITNQSQLTQLNQNKGRNAPPMIGLTQKGSFTEAVNSLVEEEKVANNASMTYQDKKSQQLDQIDKSQQDLQYLDDLLLNNQTEFPVYQGNNLPLQKSQMTSYNQFQEGVPSMKRVIYEEIKRRFSRNIDNEFLKYHQSSAISKMNTQQSSQLNQGQPKNSATLNKNLQQQAQLKYISVFDQSVANSSQIQISQNPSQTQLDGSFVINTNFMQNLARNNILNQNTSANPQTTFNMQKSLMTKFKDKNSQLNSLNQSLSVLDQNSSIHINNDINTMPLTMNSSVTKLGLSMLQMEQLYQKSQEDPFDNEQEIEFYGDPSMIALVQLNADMGHIAMNVFETFTLFDILNKSTQQQNENIQNIYSQNSIIQQRQEKMDNKLDELEQQLLIIKQLKQYKPNHNPLTSIPQEMRY